VSLCGSLLQTSLVSVVASLLLAFRLESQPHAFWHGRWGRSRDSEGDLDRVVDEPLESSESTNHDDTWAKTSPAALPAEILEDLAGGRAWGLVEHGHDAIGWVRDDGAEDTGNVTGGKCDNELLALAALCSWLGHDVSVEELDGLLKARELHHSVRDLAHPEWLDTLEEWIAAFLGHLCVGFAHVAGVAGHGLDSDLHGFEWSQKHISKELGRCGGGEVKCHSLGVSSLFADDATVHYLEDLVEAELTDTLEGVAQQGRCPALGKTLHAILSDRELETSAEVLVLCSVHLQSAFDQIERHNSGVRDTARQKTAYGTESIELASSRLTGVL